MAEKRQKLQREENEEAKPDPPFHLVREEKPDINNQGPPGKMPKSEMQSTGLPSSAQLFEQAQSLIDEINSKRKNDTVLLENFKKSMEMKIEECSSTLEKTIFQGYDITGASMQEKMQDLYATLDRISKLEQELVQFKDALGSLYNEVART